MKPLLASEERHSATSILRSTSQTLHSLLHFTCCPGKTTGVLNNALKSRVYLTSTVQAVLVRKTAITQVLFKTFLNTRTCIRKRRLKQPTTAAALSLTPHLESDVKRSTADVSKAAATWYITWQLPNTVIPRYTSYQLTCFRSHERLPPATPSLPQAPLFGRSQFSYLLESANVTASLSGLRRSNSIAHSLYCRRSFAVKFALLGAKHSESNTSRWNFWISFLWWRFT
jgi:hypothetical protein